MAKYKKYVWDCDVYKKDFILFVGELSICRPHIHKLCTNPEKLNDEDLDECEGYTVKIDTGANIVAWMREDKASVLAHEAFHMTCRCFASIGFDPEELDQEPFAYLLEAIIRNLGPEKRKT
jgi:hypothetical protein